MKNIIKLLGFIAMAAAIGFSMTACGDSGGGGGGGTVTFSLVKVSDTSFTINVAGANWKSDLDLSDDSYDNDLAGLLKCTGKCKNDEDYEKPLGDMDFNMVRTSNKVITFTLKTSYTITEEATVSFASHFDPPDGGVWITDGGVSVNYYGDTTYQLDPGKKSITLAASE